MSKWAIYQGDALENLKTMPDASFDAVLCDPPYGLKFMGKEWDHGVPSKEVWAEVLRVLKPGAFLLAFGGTRTSHRLTCAIEDAGFEIRDCAMWLYGSGFPKSMDISKALDKAAGATREVVGVRQDFASKAGFSQRPNTANAGGYVNPHEIGQITAPATDAAKTWNGYGTALKPAWEPCIVAMKPLDGTFAENALAHGVAGLNIGASRIATTENLNGGAYAKNKQDDGQWGTMHRSTGQDFVQPEGRWPANLILDAGAGAMLDEQTGALHARGNKTPTKRQSGGVLGWGAGRPDGPVDPSDSGGASRFFYQVQPLRGEEAGLALGAWNQEPAPTVDNPSSPSRLPDDSAPSGVATSGAPVGTASSGCLGLSTNGTESESRPNAVSDTPWTTSIEGRCWPESSPIATATWSVSLANPAGTSEPTDTTTTIPSRMSSDGCAESATSSSMLPGLAPGEVASRFKYCAKASRRERDAGLDGFDAGDRKTPMAGRGQGGLKCRTCGKWKASGNPCQCEVPDFEPTAFQSPAQRNTHPCLKPLDLCRYLASLILPPQRDTPRRILVPFSGSGSEMIGALQAGWDEAVGLEMEAEYVAIAEARLAHWVKSPEDFEPEPADTPEPEPPVPDPAIEAEVEPSPAPQSQPAPPPVDDFSDLPLFGAGA